MYIIVEKRRSVNVSGVILPVLPGKRSIPNRSSDDRFGIAFLYTGTYFGSTSGGVKSSKASRSFG